MADITLDDLIRWEPNRLRLAGNQADAQSRCLPISWAVTIRATSPVLPQLRGDELIVVPSAILDELHETEDIDWGNLLDLLQTRPVAAILTDREPPRLPAGVPVLLAGSEVVERAEAELNREVTERRAGLYRLGSELSRALTSASMAGVGLDQFLEAAESVSGQPLALLTASGTALARSGSFPAGIDIDPGAESLEAGEASARVEAGQADWLLAAVESNALPPGVVLAVGLEPGASGERARLVLREVAQALGLLFDRLPPVTAPTVERERERFVRDLLEGRAAPGQRRWRRLLPGFDPRHRLRVGVPVAPCARLDLGPLVPALVSAPGDDGRQALLFADALVERVHALAQQGSLPPLALSEPVETPEELPGAFRRAEAAARLAASGLLPGRLIDLGDPSSSGVPGLVLALATWGAGSLSCYADDLLGPLDAYDAGHGGVLVSSLDAYLAAGTSVSEAAERLGVHRNTLAYRLSRIREVGEYDLDDPTCRLALHLAITIRQVLAALRPDPGAGLD